MKEIIAVFVLIVAVMTTSAEPPRFRPPPARQTAFQPPSSRQTAFQPSSAQQASAPYNPRGWRPQGALLSLPVKSQPQQAYGPPSPAPSYGPPPTTTEDLPVESTEPPQVGKFTSGSSENSESTGKEKGNTFVVVVPQSSPLVVAQPQVQKLVYEVAVPQSAAIVGAPVPVSPFKTFYVPQTGSYIQVANNW